LFGRKVGQNDNSFTALSPNILVILGGAPLLRFNACVGYSAGSAPVGNAVAEM